MYIMYGYILLCLCKPEIWLVKGRKIGSDLFYGLAKSLNMT